MKTIAMVALMLLAVTTANATQQIEDLLILDSKIYTIDWPKSPFILQSYIKQHGLKLSGDMSEANYNGHHAIWLVRDKKLYLIGFDSEMPGLATPGVKDLPGSKNGELFAQWFTGTLSLKYGFRFSDVSDVLKEIRFEKGIMTGSQQADR